MKAFSITPGRLAADLAVDKSVVTRWLAGRAAPTSHNLARLTRHIAGLRPGFNMLDWGLDPDAFAARLGVDAGPDSPGPFAGLLPVDMLREARALSGLRARRYEGLWRCTRPSNGRPGRFVRDGLIIRREGSGLLAFRMATEGLRYDGWLYPTQTQIFAIAADAATGLLLFAIFNTVAGERAETMDGLILSPCRFGAGAPVAFACLLERQADLTGDREADDGAFEALLRRETEVIADDLSPVVRRRLSRDIGPGVLTLDLAGSPLRGRLLAAPRDR
jgi:hypothetical protein